MARAQDSAILVLDGRGGRNGGDSPLALHETELAEAVNVDWWDGTLANKRGGAADVSLTCSSGGPFSGTPDSLYAHLPSADLTALELWAVDSTGQIFRLAGAATWAETTPADAIATRTMDVTFASANGWLFACYDSSVNRLHVWTGAAWRRVGLATPSAPSGATMGGSGNTFTRYYRQRYVEISGSDTVRRSEASSSVSVSITDDAGVTVTKSAALSEGETHWELEAADASSGPWYRIAQTAVGTTTYDDTAATISTTNPTPTTGANTVPTSWKYILHDQGRLLGAGAWETSGAKHSRVWFTAQLGSTAPSVGDLERVPETTDFHNWVDLDEHDGGFITGFGGPMEGSVYVFKYRQIWKLVRTGNAVAPYKPFALSKVYGAIRQQSIVMAEDETGNPALYFLSHRGPMRVGGNGVEYLGNNIEDIWETFSPGATSVTCHGVYYSAKHQVWWWIATGTNAPDLKIVFDTRLGRSFADGVRFGWAQHTGESAEAHCSTMFANTIGASMSIDQKPYLGKSDETKIWKCDSGTNDAGTNFQAYITTQAYPVGGLLKHARVGQPVLVGKAASGVTIQGTVTRDFGVETKTDTVLLTASGSETRVAPQFEALELAGVTAVQYTIGDAAAASNAWTLDALVAPMALQEPR